MSTAEQDTPLTAGEIKAIEALAARYDDRSAACIDALKLIQKSRGWISDARLRQIAALLGMSAADLDGVATFYNLIFRRPVGRHVIMLCDSISCWIMGQEAVLAAIEEKFGLAPGRTSADQRFTLLPIVCLGHCDHAPAMMVDDDLHGDLDPARIAERLDSYR